jgi:hypothetical protein
LDGDGRPDAVVFNGDTWLLLSSVARPLGTPIVHPAGPRPTDGTWSFFNAVALGDVDGDGRPDLAVTDADDDRVGVLINAGNGTFGPARELSEAQASHPDAVAFGDLNGDGRLDLAVGNVNGVNVALNDGTGVFPAVSPFHPSPQVLSLAIGDLNGDGRADIVAGRYQGLDVLLATSGVTTATSYAMPGAGSMSVTLGDVTGDGKPDIVLALRGPPPQVSILVNQGDGSFVADPTPLKTGGPPVAVAIGDLDGDGRADLAVGTEPDQVCTSSGNLALFFNRGDRFDGPFRLGRDDYGAVAIADVDGNGTLDVAAGGRGILELYLNDGTGVFSAPVRYAGLAAPSMMVAGDVDGDGRTDLALADQDGRVAVYLNSATVTSR